MQRQVRINNSSELPYSIKRSLGIGKFKAKVLHRPDGEIIAKAIQDIGEVIVKLTYIRGSRALSLELTENEIHRILLMARDVRRMTGRKSREECKEIWLEEI